MSEDLVSIIIPVFNCEKYIGECLKSVVSQIYKNIEVIIIDDESTDKSASICEKYAEKYSFIQVIHQKNAGSGFARNKGLDLLKGDYYTFVDADDYISKSFIKDMLGVCKEYDADLVECGNVYLLETRNILKNDDHRIIVSDSKEQIEQSKNMNRNTVWGRLYRTERFRDIRFSNKTLGEDDEYSKKILEKCSKIVHYNYCLYGYRSYQESITRPVINNVAIKKLKKCVELEDKRQFESVVNKYIDSVIHRKEEKLYAGKFKRIMNLYKKASFYSEEAEIYHKMNDLLCVGNNNFSEKLYLKVKHYISNILAKFKIIINYKYKLD